MQKYRTRHVSSLRNRPRLGQEIFCAAVFAGDNTLADQLDFTAAVFALFQRAQAAGIRRVENAFIPVDVTAEDLQANE